MALGKLYNSNLNCDEKHLRIYILQVCLWKAYLMLRYLLTIMMSCSTTFTNLCSLLFKISLIVFNHTASGYFVTPNLARILSKPIIHLYA